ncbi:SCO7613 C-terminal domain-containing membrane protein [Dactylosporangium sp. CA-052675]|uniref:SCO7613 C-terminal domain-containing membrane protein n=1 Tax=Dactylosporangium sp. CA-052675 TaxID=3239927 RepID=UPI003D8A09CB
METYPCPACGGPASEATGCRSCGRPHDPDAAALAMFQRTVAALEQKKRDLTENTQMLRKQLAHTSAQRDSLRRKVRAAVDAERAAQEAKAKRPLLGRQRESVPPAATPASAPAEPVAVTTSTTTTSNTSSSTSSNTSSSTTSTATLPPSQQRFSPRAPRAVESGHVPAAGGPRIAPLNAPPPPRRPSGGQKSLPPGDQPEATESSMQASVLALGGLLLAGAAIVLTLDAFGSIGTVGRVLSLAVITAIALALPLVLVKRGLSATAETVASVALLLVLLDGYVVRSEKLLGADRPQFSTYLGLVCLLTAGVAAVYSMQSHLIASRYATLLALQPVLPLLFYDAIHGPTGWAIALSGVALIDLGFAVALKQSIQRRIDAHHEDAAAEDELAHTGRTNRIADGLMRDLAWILFAVATGVALLAAAVGLAVTDERVPTLQAAAAMLVAAALGVGGALTWRRGTLPDIAAGVATGAVIVAIARVGAVWLPGSTPLFLALAVTVAAAGVPFLPEDARRGPRYAVSVAAAGATLLVLVRAFPGIVAPLRAAWPVWKSDLGAYEDRIHAAVGPEGWQYVIAILLLTGACILMLSGRTDPVAVRLRDNVGPEVPPDELRTDIAVVGAALTLLVAPAALGLSWLAIPALAVSAAVVIGALALRVRAPHTAWVCLGAALLLGLYAAAAALIRPGATALTLTAIAVAGAAIAWLPRPHQTDGDRLAVTQRVADAAAGGALFALPGAAASGAAIVFGGLPGGATVVLVLSFLALAVSLGVAALIQVARDRAGAEPSVPLLVGATAGAVAVGLATVIAPGATTIDFVIGLLMLVAAVMLWAAPRMDDRHTFGVEFSGSDAAAAAVTIAAIGALARAVSLAASGIEVVVLAVLVFLVAVAARSSLPEEWRRGPVAGAAMVGLGTGLYAGALSMIGAIGVIRAADPMWHAPLDARWAQTAHGLAEFGWQIPIALLLLAGAAAIALPQPYGDDTASAALVLATLGAPVGLGLGWSAPMVIGWAAATGVAVWASFARSWRGVYTRLGAALVAGLYAAGASLVRPGATAGTLAALGISGAFVAALARAVALRRAAEDTRARDPHEDGEDDVDGGPLTVVGGAGVAGALFAFTGAAAAMVGSLYPDRPSTILIAALATAAVGLAAAAAGAQQAPGYMPYVSTGVAVAATTTALAALVVQRDGAVVYAAAAALLGVLAELLRANWYRPAEPELGRFRPDRAGRAGRPRVRAGEQRIPRNFAIGVAAAAGIPAAIVVVFIAPALFAALAGPYRWLQQPWTGTPETAAHLGSLAQYAGNSTHVLGAFLLTVAAALMAVGLGGDGQAMANRAVAIVVPGAALTLLIAPAALDAPWPVQPTLALLVATIAGLGLALTLPPSSDSPDARLMTGARRLVFVIAVLAAGAGGAGSLATRSQTLTWLAGSVVVGAIGGIWGKTATARMLGWNVAASTAEGFAVAAGLAAGLNLKQCAFPLLIVATALLVLGAALPRLRPSDSINREAMTVEAAGYAGAAIAVLLTLGSWAHTAAALTAVGAILGLSAARKGRSPRQRTTLIVAASIAELLAIWLLLMTVQVAVPEAYTIPFAALALITGLIEIRNRPELGSWLAYGPALVAGFGPSLAIAVAQPDSPELRQVLLILAGVICVAIGAARQQKAPVAVGAAVTVIATVNELFRIGLPFWMMLLLFTGTGVLLISLGATYEQRQRLDRLRGVYRGMR